MRAALLLLAVAAMGTGHPAPAQLPAAPVDEVLLSGGPALTEAMVEAQAAPLLSALTDAQRSKVGRLDVRVAQGSDDRRCASALRLAFSEHAEARTVLTLCGEAYRILTDMASVELIHPFLGSLTYEELMAGAEVPLRYTRLMIDAASRQRKADGSLAFPLSYCSPFSFLLAYAASEPATQPCTESDEARARATVLAAVDRSAILASLINMNVQMEFIDAGVKPRDFLAIMKVMTLKGVIDFLIAHEISHIICETACSEEKTMDGLAFDLMLRNPETMGVPVNLQAAGAVLSFSSIFNDPKLAFGVDMDMEAFRLEIVHRRSRVACRGLEQLDLMIQRHGEEMAAFSKQAQLAGPLMGALAGGNLALIRFQLAAQCQTPGAGGSA